MLRQQEMLHSNHIFSYKQLLKNPSVEEPIEADVTP
jgi:hypothetical protein